MPTKTSSPRFLSQLEQEARRQANLQQHSLLPRQLGGLGRWVANHSWQFLVLISTLTALIITLLNR